VLFILMMAPVARTAEVQPLLISLSPPGEDPMKQGRQESEHRPAPFRKYWLNQVDPSPDTTAYVLRPSGTMDPVGPDLTASGTAVSFQTPMGDGPMHGVHNLYVVDRYLAGSEQIVRTAKWIVIHHNCGWGHDYKYDEGKTEAKSSSGIPLEIVGSGLWDRYLHSHTSSGDLLDFKVLHYGRPVDGAKVVLETAHGWTKELTTGPDGTASFKLVRDYYPQGWQHFNRRHRDRFKVVAEYVEAKSGEYEGAAYESVRHISSLSWTYSPSRSDYSSYSHGLLIGSLSLAITGVGIYAYRERRKRPYREVRFRETD
jgi:hypothetical protein